MDDDTLQGVIFEEGEAISLDELCQLCSVEVEWITTLVNEGILEPVEFRHKNWIFSGSALRRIRVVKHLQQDLDINIAGVALVLELLEERNMLLAKSDSYQ
ncbi:chaperone modulator CbpM [Nitrosomonas sp.]|uniref:chaperone modulator CbpM n=1 Tax=Nitrosomonas sp. TaxID=42353 RepID=UPI0025FCC209|nr:chaperone modulator CbpM [Nitrosomonas sp.]